MGLKFLKIHKNQGLERSLLKEEIFYETTTFTSTDELKQVIDEYIHYYNHDRIKSKLKGLSPVKYRNLVQLGLIQPLATT